jgi:ribosomal protein S18 acetylase RimI-like enzyme
MSTLHVGPARPEHEADALRLVFDTAAAGNFDVPPAMELLTATRGDRLVGAACVQRQPGRAAAVYPPRIAADEPMATVEALVDACLARARAGSAVFAQALLETDAGQIAEAFEKLGFRHITELLYLVSESESFPETEPPCVLTLVPYSDRDADRLAHIIERTYQDSLDCPAACGMRSVADILAGYAATGTSGTAQWLLLANEQTAVGCLLLTDHATDDQWELVYLGLVPDVRGRGWGFQVTRQAQWLTKQAGRKRLVLAVDAENGPAIAAYSQCGFTAWDRRSVFVRTL